MYDALTSRRSYREPWSHARANAYIAEQAGQMFDPALSEIWLRLPQLGASEPPAWTWHWPRTGLDTGQPAHPSA